ncbi:hypothetical protein ACFE04_003013 [Oxalis oulophora]
MPGDGTICLDAQHIVKEINGDYVDLSEHGGVICDVRKMVQHRNNIFVVWVKRQVNMGAHDLDQQRDTMKRRRSTGVEKEDNNREEIQSVKEELVDAMQENGGNIGDKTPIGSPHPQEEDPEEDPEEIADDHQERSNLDENNHTGPELLAEKATPPTKRANGENSNTELMRSRKIRKSKGGRRFTPSPSSYRMIWNIKDEIALLEGMLNYYSTKEVDPTADREELYKYVKKLISVDITKQQMFRKVARFKEKFQNNMNTVRRTGKDPEFLKPHEKNVFKISKSIWGVDVEEIQQGEEDEEEENEDPIPTPELDPIPAPEPDPIPAPEPDPIPASEPDPIPAPELDSIPDPELNSEPEPVQDEGQSNDDPQQLAIGEEGETLKPDDKEDEETSKPDDKAELEKFWSSHPCLNHSLRLEEFSKYWDTSNDTNYAKGRLFSLGSAKADELEAKWRQLEMDEAELKLKRAQLVFEQTKLLYK